MARAFAKISFTPDVKQVQATMGSRSNYQRFEQGDAEPVQLTEFEKHFILQRDSFYQATVSQNGWPYVQHRGGPVGFIKVIDDHTIGYADFTGNRQYLSVGNLTGDDRVSLILMDYSQQQRLKIWGRASIVDESSDPELLAQLEPVNSRAPVERGIIIKIEAFDWNCPKYITPRFSQQQVDAMLAERSTIITSPEYRYTGTGNIPLVITAVEQITDQVRTYRFGHRDKGSLPIYQAGAHINVPVQLADGSQTTRSYSLLTSGHEAEYYQIAVKRDSSGNGGSLAIHQHWQVGTEININPPENYFGLHQDNRPSILIAGGIGITAIMAIAEQLKHQNAKFELHYTSQTQQQMAFMKPLLNLYGERCHLYFSREAAGNRLDLKQLIAAADPQAIFYVCGPKALLQQALTIADQLGRRQQINFESFQ